MHVCKVMMGIVTSSDTYVLLCKIIIMLNVAQ